MQNFRKEPYSGPTVSNPIPLAAKDDRTEVGSYFVATYPPFSVWTAEAVDRDARPALAAPPSPGVPLGMYLHIPFCRKRCHFCYFRVYTDKNAQEVAEYLDVLAREWEQHAQMPAIAGRPLSFVYFGGGTPSFLSTQQLEGLVARLAAVAPWREAEEVTFECEPGTLTGSKLEAIRRIGVTRLSLGIENFDDRVLELNGRAHRSKEVFRAYEQARALDFPQINIDLIAGMLGETEENWRACVERAVDLDPDSVTDLSDGAAVQHGDQRRSAERNRPVLRARRRLGDEAALGAGGFRGARGRRLPCRQRVHGGQESSAHPVRLPRSPLAGRRHGRARCRIVRPHQRRARAEPRHLGAVQRRGHGGRASA